MATADDDNTASEEAMAATLRELQQPLLSGEEEKTPGDDDDDDSIIDPSGKAKLAAPFDIDEVDRMLPISGLISFVVWVLLLSLVYGCCPDHYWEHVDREERYAAEIATLVMSMSAFLIFVSCVLRSASNWSGIIVCAAVVQGIAVVTNILLAYSNTAVGRDSVTMSRVFLIRWCEWTPLAGLMTFLSDVVDLRPTRSGSRYDALKMPVFTAVMQSLSCACGFYFPFAFGLPDWLGAMVISVSTYMTMFPRLLEKNRVLHETKLGLTTRDKENYDRCRFSRNLFAVCTFVWTVLVVLYFINMSIMRFLPVGHYFRRTSLAMMVDTTFEVIAKALYMKVIVEVHILVFDRDLRAQRQLGELRRLMAVLWDTSSDVIVITIRNGKTRLTSMFSPAYIRMLGATLPRDLEDSAALMIETYHYPKGAASYKSNEKSQVMKASYVCYSDLPLRDQDRRNAQQDSLSPNSPVAQAALEIVEATWKHCPNDGCSTSLFVHAQQKIDGGMMSHCEVQVSQHRANSLVAIVRDVTERYRRFEAERRAHSETRARQRDAQAVNRFTRHEVKNGLLAGIELCNSLTNSLEEIKLPADNGQEALVNGLKRPQKHVHDLEASMREMLDIVLAEAMARDVIHEVYQAKKEQVDVMALLTNSRMGVGNFPLESAHPDMPTVVLDPQLVGYIHRNAISNACKYGKKGGEVLTKVAYLESTKEFQMKVINEPGDGHEKLLAMGTAAADAIFSQGTRLHAHLDTKGSNLSAGDGAWIAQKCAKNMGGQCNIEFEESRVVFTFQCPADRFAATRVKGNPRFEVPRDTWGVGLDDSRMQRKMMHRIFGYMGLDESKQVLVGKNPAEVASLGNVVSNILTKHVHCHLVMLVDENLDYGQNGVLSGSMEVRDLLQKLTPKQQARVLAVVRSANDSAEDVSTYLHRLHGFFPKAHMDREQVRELTSTLWVDRFPQDDEVSFSDEESSADDSIGMGDILQPLQHVEDLLAQEEGGGSSSWPSIWQALHVLRGDMMVLEQSDQLVEASKLIGQLKGPVYPDDLPNKWKIIQELIKQAVGVKQET